MYKVSPTFDDLLQDQKGFLIKMARHIHRQPDYKHNAFEDVYQMVLYSGFRAWEYQRGKSIDGHCKYAFGTFFNNCIKTGLKDYDDLKKAQHLTVVDSVKIVDQNFEVPDDIHQYYTKGFTELENKVYHHLFIDNLEVKETATKLNISPEYVRTIWGHIKEKVKDKIC